MSLWYDIYFMKALPYTLPDTLMTYVMMLLPYDVMSHYDIIAWQDDAIML